MSNSEGTEEKLLPLAYTEQRAVPTRCSHLFGSYWADGLWQETMGSK